MIPVDKRMIVFDPAVACNFPIEYVPRNEKGGEFVRDKSGRSNVEYIGLNFLVGNL